MSELAEHQLRGPESSDATPPRVVNPQARETFVPLRIDEYERLSKNRRPNETSE